MGWQRDVHHHLDRQLFVHGTEALMAAREKLAWVLLILAATALAVAAFSPTRVQVPVASQTSVPAASPETTHQLARIEDRLEHLEAARRVDGSSSAPATPAATTPTAIEPERSAPVDTQSAAAMERSRLAASALVDRAIQAGSWTRKDADAWMTASAGMRAEDRFALVRRLVVEVNNDRVKLEPGATFR
jgi:hypothetical protein